MQKRERLATLAGAIMFTLAVPTAFLQEYCKYNPYLLPGLGLAAILLYLGYFLTSNTVVKLARSFYAKSSKWSIVCLLIAIVVIGFILWKAEWYVIGKSKEHVSALKTKDMPPKEKISQLITVPNFVQPKQSTTKSPKQYSPQTVPVSKELSHSSKPSIVKKQDIPDAGKVIPSNIFMHTPQISGSNPSIRICKNHPNDNFVRQGQSRLRISVSEVKKENNETVVNCKLCMVDDEQERNIEKFSSVTEGSCITYDNYSIRVNLISPDFDCAWFAVSYNEKSCKQK